MPVDELLAGSTSNRLPVFIQDSSVTTGAGLTGLTGTTSSLTGWYWRENATANTAITLANGTLGTYASGTLVAVANGAYQFCIPDAAVASGANDVLVYLGGATNMVPRLFNITLKAVNLQDAVRAGLTALPNANAAASGGLLILGANTGTVTVSGAWTFTGGVALGNVAMTSFSNSGTSNTAGLTTLAGFSTGAMTTSSLVVGAGSVTLNGNLTGNLIGGISGSVNSVTTNVGINWALTTNPTASMNLSGTTISTNQSISQATLVLTTQTASTVTGAVAVDWSLITNPTASKAFTGTTISSNQSVSQATLVLTTQTASTVTGAVTVDWSLITNATATKAFTGSTISSNQSVSQATLVLTTQSASTLSSAERLAVADALLDRDMATGVDSGGRTVRNALRIMRNKVSLTVLPGNLTVYKEDDSTSAWTAALTTSSTSSAITVIDPG